jgi:hypothetical protein
LTASLRAKLSADLNSRAWLTTSERPVLKLGMAIAMTMVKMAMVISSSTRVKPREQRVECCAGASGFLPVDFLPVDLLPGGFLFIDLPRLIHYDSAESLIENLQYQR